MGFPDAMVKLSPMLHLASPTPPADADALQRAITDGLSRYLDATRPGAVVLEESGEGWPRLSLLQADLSGSRVRVSELPSKPPELDAASVQPGPTAESLKITGQPIDVDGCPVGLQVEGQEVELGYGHETGGDDLMLVLRSARDGHVRAMVARQALEDLLRRRAADPMAKQGVKLQDLTWSIEQDGPRAATLHATVIASKKVVFANVNGTFHFNANLAVDDNMVATLSGLTCKGEGVIGSAAAPFIQTKLAEQEGKQVPLMSLIPGGVTLRDVALTTDPTSISITAKFGG